MFQEIDWSQSLAHCQRLCVQQVSDFELGQLAHLYKTRIQLSNIPYIHLQLVNIQTDLLNYLSYKAARRLAE